jgi:hypothetical protein
MIKKCEYCRVEFNSPINMNPYCSSKCRSKSKFILIKGKGKPFNVWKKNYEKYPDFYNSLASYKDRIKNKCFVCGKEFENFSMCCSSECSKEMKKESTFLTTGSTHNLSRDSISRKNMENHLLEKHGVSNVFSRKDVVDKLKDTWVKKYGYSNPSKVDFIKNKKRKTAEKNGFWCPKEKMTIKNIYDENVHNITWSQMKKFAQLKFGKDIWERIKESKNLDQKDWLTVDHRYSRSMGFVNNISPEIIGHICNLEIISFSDNREKNYRCSIDIDSLMIEINEFNKKILSI